MVGANGIKKIAQALSWIHCSNSTGNLDAAGDGCEVKGNHIDMGKHKRPRV